MANLPCEVIEANVPLDRLAINGRFSQSKVAVVERTQGASFGAGVSLRRRVSLVPANVDHLPIVNGDE